MKTTPDSPGGEHLYAAFAARAERCAQRTALRMDERARTYAELDRRIRRLAGVLLDRFELRRGEPVALFAEKTFEWPTVSMALQALGAVEMPRETTLDVDEFRELFERVAFRLVFVQSRAILPRLWPAVPAASARELVVIVLEADQPDSAGVPAPGVPPPGVRVLDFESLLESEIVSGEQALRSRLAARQAEIDPDDPAAVIRTSGTTGRPKLVRLSHRNFLHNMRALPLPVGLVREDRVLSCLPAWHLYARIVEYTALATGAEIVYCQLPEIQAALARFRPTVFPGFPEIWERAFHGILAGIEELPWPARVLFRFFLFCSRRRYAGREHALGCGWRSAAAGSDSRAVRLARRCFGALQWSLFEVPHRLGDFVFYRRVRALFGGRLRVAIIGDAPLPLFIDENLRALGLRVLEGYGSTEQCVSAVREIDCNALHTAGRPLADTRMTILDEAGRSLPPGRTGRIAVAGPNVFTAYDDTAADQKPPEFVQLEGERFYFTGDLGQMDATGRLRLVGREKNRFRLAGRGVVYPERVENILRGSKFVAQVAVLGRDRPYLCAFIVPDPAELVVFLRRRLRSGARRRLRTAPRRSGGRGLFHRELDARFLERPEFLRRIVRLPAVVRLVENEARALIAASDLQPHEIPQRIALVGTPFVPGQELTPTLKLRRSIIERKYYAELEAEFENARWQPPAAAGLRLSLIRRGMRRGRRGGGAGEG